MSGVCTLGRTDGSDKILWGISEYAFGIEMYELLFVVLNVMAALAVRREAKMYLGARRELKKMSRASLILLIYDILFRFGAVQQLIGLIRDANAQSIVRRIWDEMFAYLYVSGMGAFLAHYAENLHTKYFQLYAWRRRFWRLLFTGERFTAKEILDHEEWKSKWAQENDEMNPMGTPVTLVHMHQRV